ncbi:MAG: RdgB/HAM1 family non-canonical purine NTP pyrophosphatase [Blastocatellia bacterium]|nr:RdgB/HAM1 family non-canonical purine NTP pyrophosphatase [Blastocatellia bacterium]
MATTNEGKIKELEQILGDEGLEVTGLGTMAAAEDIENGSTFVENALLKARYYHRVSGLPTIADDSGLEVEALGGAPGLYSARYGGPDATDGDRLIKLLEEMAAVPPEERGARFVCAAAIVWEGGERIFEDEARGFVTDGPRGEGGFGYDPIFYYPPLEKTFAELTPVEKAEMSHRARAFRRLAGWLRQTGALDTIKTGGRIMNSTA